MPRVFNRTSVHNKTAYKEDSYTPNYKLLHTQNMSVHACVKFKLSCTILCGDFRKILPVIQRWRRCNIVDSCLKKTFLWEHVVVKHLHTNMRVHLCEDEAAGQFTDQLLAVGDGRFLIDTSPDVFSYLRTWAPL